MDELDSRNGHRTSFDPSGVDPSILQYIHQLDSEEQRPRKPLPPPRPLRLKRIVKKLNEPAHYLKAPGKPILKQPYSTPSNAGIPPPGGFAAQQQQFLDSIYEGQETDTDVYYESSDKTRRNGMDLERARLNIKAKDLAIPEPLDNEFWAPGHWKAKTGHPTTFIHAEAVPPSSKGRSFDHAALNADPPSIPTSAASIPTNAEPPTSAFSNCTSEVSDTIEHEQEDDGDQASRQGNLPNVPAPAFRSNNSGQPGWFPDFHPAYESNYTKRRPAPLVPDDINELQHAEARQRVSFPSRPSFTFRAPSHAPTLQRQHSVVSPYTPHPWTPNPFEADFQPGQRNSAYFSPVVTPSANPWEDVISGAKRKADEDEQKRKKRRVAFALSKSFRSDHPKILRQQTPYYDSSLSSKFRKLFSRISRVFHQKSPEERRAEKERKLKEKRDRMESEESEELRSGFSGHEWASSGSGGQDSGDNEYVY